MYYNKTMLGSICGNLEKYNFTKENIVAWDKQDSIIMHKLNEKRSSKNLQKNRLDHKNIIIKNIDKLFWFFYIALNGIDDYNYICDLNNTFKIEKEIKIRTVTEMRRLKDVYKIYRIKRIGVENELVNEEKIGYNTLHILCLNHKVDLLIVSGKMFKKLHGNIDSNYDPKYIINVCDGISEFKELSNSNIYCNRLIEISNIEKPLNSIAYYKLDELRNMCNKLSIEINKNEKKQSLYNKLHNYVIKLF